MPSVRDLIGGLSLFVVAAGAGGCAHGPTAKEPAKEPPVSEDEKLGPQFVIPPGREALVIRMTGEKSGPLPLGCHLETASIAKTTVSVGYKCGGGKDVSFKLAHPSAAPASLAHTEKFAIVGNADAPAELVEALRAHVAATETAWEWVLVGKKADEKKPDASPAGGVAVTPEGPMEPGVKAPGTPPAGATPVTPTPGASPATPTPGAAPAGTAPGTASAPPPAAPSGTH